MYHLYEMKVIDAKKKDHIWTLMVYSETHSFFHYSNVHLITRL